jgi:hypothetical protein
MSQKLKLQEIEIAETPEQRDQRLRERVRSALEKTTGIDASRLNVRVVQGVLDISGSAEATREDDDEDEWISPEERIRNAGSCAPLRGGHRPINRSYARR